MPVVGKNCVASAESRAERSSGDAHDGGGPALRGCPSWLHDARPLGSWSDG
jgi:hypothetical protein